MRLTRATDYMLRCVDYLARQDPEVVVPRSEVIAAAEIPDAFFRKLVQDLSRAGIIKVTRGKLGGYRLAVPADELSLLQVIEVAGGELALNDCVIRPESCRRSPSCAVHQVLDEATRRLRETLGELTFAELAKRGACVLQPLSTASESRR